MKGLVISQVLLRLNVVLRLGSFDARCSMLCSFYSRPASLPPASPRDTLCRLDQAPVRPVLSLSCCCRLQAKLSTPPSRPSCLLVAEGVDRADFPSSVVAFRHAYRVTSVSPTWSLFFFTSLRFFLSLLIGAFPFVTGRFRLPPRRFSQQCRSLPPVRP